MPLLRALPPASVDVVGLVPLVADPFNVVAVKGVAPRADPYLFAAVIPYVAPAELR